jgi:hypothetical protein
MFRILAEDFREKMSTRVWIDLGSRPMVTLLAWRPSEKISNQSYAGKPSPDLLAAIDSECLSASQLRRQR